MARTRTHRKKRTGLATKPRMMTKSQAAKRYQNISTKVFYFRGNGTIQTQATGTYFLSQNVQNIIAVPPVQLTNVFGLYDEYKILALRIRWFPANVGIESDTAILGSNGLLRGDVVIWSDQKGDVVVAAPASIGSVINFGSCRMINPRRPQSRVLYRPKGHPEWGKCSNPGGNPDSWDGSINMYGQDTTTTANRKLWYYTVTYKVLVRGRRQ